MNAAAGSAATSPRATRSVIVREYNGFLVSHHRHRAARRVRLRARLVAPDLLWHARGRQGLDRQLGLSLGHRQRCLSWRCSGRKGMREVGELILQRGTYAARRLGAIGGRAGPLRRRLLQGVRRRLRRHRQTVSPRSIGACSRSTGSSAARICRLSCPSSASGPLLRHRDSHRCRHRPAGCGSGGGAWHEAPELRDYHAPVWDEPLVMELGAAGSARPCSFHRSSRRSTAAVGAAADAGAGGHAPQPIRPHLPELSEPEVQRHYLRLQPADAGHDEHQPLRHLHHEIQCRAPASEAARRLPGRGAPAAARGHAAGHPGGSIHGFDLILRELSGMDQFMFQAGGGADAAYTHCRGHPRLAPRRAASWGSATRSSPRSRRIPATPPPRPPPASRW